MPWVPETFHAWFPVSVLPRARKKKKKKTSGTQGKSTESDFVIFCVLVLFPPFLCCCCDSVCCVIHFVVFFLALLQTRTGKPVVAWQVLRVASAFSFLAPQRIRVDAHTFSPGIT